MVPVRVTAPVGPVVSLDDLKEHLRVDHDADDALITAYEAAAMAYLDGWRGRLGRCILSQQWAVTYEEAGTYRLPFPDVSAVSAVDADEAAIDVTLTHDATGSWVEIASAGTVTMTAALPDDALGTVVMAIKLLVGHWYANRESVVAGSVTNLPLAFDALAGSISVARA